MPKPFELAACRHFQPAQQASGEIQVLTFIQTVSQSVYRAFLKAIGGYVIAYSSHVACWKQARRPAHPIVTMRHFIQAQRCLVTDNEWIDSEKICDISYYACLSQETMQHLYTMDAFIGRKVTAWKLLTWTWYADYASVVWHPQK